MDDNGTKLAELFRISKQSARQTISFEYVPDKWRVITMATAGPYADERAELLKTLDRYGIPWYTETVGPPCDWYEAVAMKAAWIAAKRREIHGPIVWLDADARVSSYPTLFSVLARAQVQFAAHWFRGSELMTSVMYLGDTGTVQTVLDDWAVRCADSPRAFGTGDQKHLEAAITGDGISPFILPPEYCWINGGRGDCDLSARVYGTKRDPVIVQTQASRRFKKPGLR